MVDAASSNTSFFRAKCQQLQYAWLKRYHKHQGTLRIQFSCAFPKHEFCVQPLSCYHHKLCNTLTMYTTWQVSAVLTCGNYLAGPREMTVSLPLPVQPSTIIVLCFSTQFTFGKGFWQHDAHPWWHVSQWQSSGVTMNFSLGCYIAMQVSFGIEGMPCACSTASRLEGWGSQIVVCALSFVMWS